jgi:hypothetical protein
VHVTTPHGQDLHSRPPPQAAQPSRQPSLN